ncbi:hypothetical protein OAR36_12720 [Pseudomonadales bacterium]|nr:hypothetical protein [Pseudomonadales bacterium]
MILQQFIGNNLDCGNRNLVTMSNTLNDDFAYHWGLETCILEDDERVIANEQLDEVLQSDLFKKEDKSDGNEDP